MELLLAVAIMAIIMAVVSGVVVSTLQAQQRIEEVTIGTEIGPVLLNQIRQDLEASFIPDASKDWFLGLDRQGSAGARDRLDFIAAVTELGAENPESEPKFNSVNELGYTAEENPKHPGELVLYRRRDPFVDESPLKGGHLTALYDHVTSFDVQYWNGTEWVASWSSQSAQGKAPQGVKVELKITVPFTNMDSGVTAPVARTYAITVVPPR